MIFITSNFELNPVGDDRWCLEMHGIERDGDGDLYLTDDQMMQLHMLLCGRMAEDYL